MTEILLSIYMEFRPVINFVVENCKIFITRDDLGKAM